MSVEYINKALEVQNTVDNNKGVTLRLMLEGIHRNANPITPLRDNGLRTSVLKTMEGTSKAIIEWREPYASYQERGMRADGTHIVRNYTTPGTHAHYAEESVKKVMDNIQEYARQGGLI